jgi:hypothetical protein
VGCSLVARRAESEKGHPALWDDDISHIPILSVIKKFRNMNKLIHFIFFAFTVLVACGGKDSSSPGTQPKPENATEQARSESGDLPDLPLTMRDGSRKSVSDLSGNIALILFQPDCDHCQREAEDIRRHITGFKDFDLYLISSAPIEEVIQFARQYDLESNSRVHLGTTTVPDILRIFGPIDAPSIYLYGKDGKLIQSFNGEVAIEVVLKYI